MASRSPAAVQDAPQVDAKTTESGHKKAGLSEDEMSKMDERRNPRAVVAKHLGDAESESHDRTRQSTAPLLFAPNRHKPSPMTTSSRTGNPRTQFRMAAWGSGRQP